MISIGLNLSGIRIIHVGIEWEVPVTGCLVSQVKVPVMCCSSGDTATSTCQMKKSFDFQSFFAHVGSERLKFK